MWWFFGTLFIGVAWWWWRGIATVHKRTPIGRYDAEILAEEESRRSTKPFRYRWEKDDDAPERSLFIQTSIESREYDTSKYRFDGTARPEWRIEYADDDGSITERSIFVNQWHDRGSLTYFDCWCYLRDERRTFRSDRMLSVVNLDTNRKIKSIRAYVMR